jgi:hypothetical protein
MPPIPIDIFVTSESSLRTKGYRQCHAVCSCEAIVNRHAFAKRTDIFRKRSEVARGDEQDQTLYGRSCGSRELTSVVHSGKLEIWRILFHTYSALE